MRLELLHLSEDLLGAAPAAWTRILIRYVSYTCWVRDVMMLGTCCNGLGPPTILADRSERDDVAG